MNKTKQIFNPFILIFLIFCSSLYAGNKGMDECQISTIESLFNHAFQLRNISEHMDQFGPSLYKSMPYVERVFRSDDPVYVVLLGTFQDEVDFSMLNREELIRELNNVKGKTELTKNSDIRTLNNSPVTVVFTSTHQQKQKTLVNLRTIMVPSNNCIIGVNISIPSESWSTTLEKNLNFKLVTFQKKILSFYGKRKNILENEFVKHLTGFDNAQSELSIKKSLPFLSKNISIKIIDCDKTFVVYDMEKFKQVYSLIQKNAKYLITKRKIIKLEDCNNGKRCTIHSKLSEEVLAFEGKYHETTLSTEIAKIEKIGGIMQITSFNGNIQCK